MVLVRKRSLGEYKIWLSSAEYSGNLVQECVQSTGMTKSLLIRSSRSYLLRLQIPVAALFKCFAIAHSSNFL